MIERYSRPEMSAVWSEKNKFEKWLQVEIAEGVIRLLSQRLREANEALESAKG